MLQLTQVWTQHWNDANIKIRKFYKGWKEKKGNKRELGEYLFDRSLAQICCQDLFYFLWSNVAMYLEANPPVSSICSTQEYTVLLSFCYLLLFDI